LIGGDSPFSNFSKNVIIIGGNREKARFCASTIKYEREENIIVDHIPSRRNKGYL
jgi:hypothetical protein